MFAQMQLEPDPVPAWVVVGAGTGGTSATIGRYIRFRPALAKATRLCVVDPEGSAFFCSYRDRDPAAVGQVSPVVEGIGRPRVERSFMPDVIDHMIAVPDAASVAACRWFARSHGRRCGPSTGTNLVGALSLASTMEAARKAGSIVTLICDGGERYADTIYDPAWCDRRELDLPGWCERFDRFERDGVWNSSDLAQAAR